MPIRYAIRVKHPAPLTQAEQLQLRTEGHSSFHGRYSYEDVPPIVAETDEENGAYALFSENGTKLSDWLPVKKSEDVEAALRLGRKKQGYPLVDSIGQKIKQGDYLYTHSHDHKKLELNQVIRNLTAKVVVEMLDGGHRWSGTSGMRIRTPDSFIKIPSALIEGGENTVEQWEKRFSVRELERTDGKITRDAFIPVPENIALQEENSYFGYFDNEGKHVTGWVTIAPAKYEQASLEADFHSKKRIFQVPPVIMTDAMGTGIRLGDVVFSNDNHYNNFMLCEVIGFTKDRVRLVGYERRGNRGSRVITLNTPKNIVKLPISVTVV